MIKYCECMCMCLRLKFSISFEGQKKNINCLHIFVLHCQLSCAACLHIILTISLKVCKQINALSNACKTRVLTVSLLFRCMYMHTYIHI